MKKHFKLLSFLACSLTASAQENNVTLQGYPSCGFNHVLQQVGVTHGQLIEGYRKNAAAKGTADPVVYDIPVVFHLVSSVSDLPDSVVYDQVNVLNKAFRHTHADTANTRAVFKPIAEDAHIQFHLATTDPSGNPTTGITRTHTSLTHFGSSLSSGLDSLERVKSTAAGGKDPWPTNRYLNIWVCNLADEAGHVTILGYGVPPLSPLPPNWDPIYAAGLAGLKDGVVLQAHAVGSNNPYGAVLGATYTKGRAMVHEVGHYLGLQHVFGGTPGSAPTSCGTAVQSDGIDDTPEQGTMSFTAGCPAATKNSCGSGPADSLDLWEDYMDYATDACQTLFTKGQVAIMRSVMGNQRLSLTTPIASASMSNVSTLLSNAIYPNPASGSLGLAYTGDINKVTILNFTGQAVFALDNEKANTKNYDISSLVPGNYLLLVRDANGNQMTGRFTVAKD